jgi:hypothetical protein
MPSFVSLNTVSRKKTPNLKAAIDNCSYKQMQKLTSGYLPIKARER